MALKRRTEARLTKLIEEAATTAFVVRPGEQPTKELLAAKAGKLGVVVPEFEAWVAHALKLRAAGFGREQTIKSLPVVTGGKVSWQGQKPKEAKMAAVKKTKSAVTTKKSKKTAPKKTAKKAKVKKSKATGRGKAVVVYFNTDNLKVLAAAKKHAAKQNEALATVVSKALTAFLK